MACTINGKLIVYLICPVPNHQSGKQSNQCQATQSFIYVQYCISSVLNEGNCFPCAMCGHFAKPKGRTSFAHAMKWHLAQLVLTEALFFARTSGGTYSMSMQHSLHLSQWERIFPRGALTLLIPLSYKEDLTNIKIAVAPQAPFLKTNSGVTAEYNPLQR